jgi:hypothetical protein
MTDYFAVITNAQTGEVSTRPYTPEEIGAVEAAIAAAAVPKVPASVTPRQVRLLLLSQGLLSQVTTLIAQQPEAAQIAWEYASEFRRDDPLLLSLATNLNLTSQQLDEFFIAAAAL